MAQGYQTQVFNQPAQGIQGDRASQNPIATFDAGPGGLVAGPAGVTVGAFAWVVPPTDPNGTGLVANSFGAGNVAGFVYNDLQALNTVFLSDAGVVIPAGLPVALANQGDFWVINNGATEAVIGQKAYATLSSGLASFAATGSPSTTSTATGSTIAASTFSVTGSIAGDVLTVTAVGSGTVVNGATTRSLFPNNQIPLARFSTVSKNILPLLPSPNNALGIEPIKYAKTRRIAIIIISKTLLRQTNL